MIYTSEAIESAIESLSALPTIGRKTAQRLTLHLLRQPKEDVEKLANALLTMKEKVRYCSQCCNLTESDPCNVCTSQKRNRSLICVVEDPSDLFAIERTNEYFGLYHVLHGALNPLDGIGPNELKIKELLLRLGEGHTGEEAQEIILAMNPNVEGEVTTQYLVKLLKPLGIKVSRLARGIPMGSDLEFADEATVSRALQGRVEA
ncbi:MAG: recombination protein RecR [Ignavibacteria bacterium]|nr:recombination protein RecR [Ignavibacteria bacterium]MBL7991317.1 recombination protein RecR [Candidatus Kapabacteria bacterium]